MVAALQMGQFTLETRIAAPIEACFDAALDVSIHAESAAFSGERLAEPGRLEGLLELGDLVCFEGRHFGIRQRFCARIVELDRPRRFVDEMLRGAFKSLRHEHSFAEVDGGTVMHDFLVWQPPLGILGAIADRLFVIRHLQRFVATKQQRLKAIIESREKA
jgi:hypothetical protein